MSSDSQESPPPPAFNPDPLLYPALMNPRYTDDSFGKKTLVGADGLLHFGILRLIIVHDDVLALHEFFRARPDLLAKEVWCSPRYGHGISSIASALSRGSMDCLHAMLEYKEKALREAGDDVSSSDLLQEAIRVAHMPYACHAISPELLGLLLERDAGTDKVNTERTRHEHNSLLALAAVAHSDLRYIKNMPKNWGRPSTLRLATLGEDEVAMRLVACFRLLFNAGADPAAVRPCLYDKFCHEMYRSASARADIGAIGHGNALVLALERAGTPFVPEQADSFEAVLDVLLGKESGIDVHQGAILPTAALDGTGPSGYIDSSEKPSRGDPDVFPEEMERSEEKTDEETKELADEGTDEKPEKFVVDEEPASEVVGQPDSTASAVEMLFGNETDTATENKSGDGNAANENQDGPRDREQAYHDGFYNEEYDDHLWATEYDSDDRPLGMPYIHLGELAYVTPLAVAALHYNVPGIKKLLALAKEDENGKRRTDFTQDLVNPVCPDPNLSNLDILPMRPIHAAAVGLVRSKHWGPPIQQHFRHIAPERGLPMLVKAAIDAEAYKRYADETAGTLRLLTDDPEICKATINSTHKGYTPLHLCARFDRIPMLKVLLDRGADPSIPLPPYEDKDNTGDNHNARPLRNTVFFHTFVLSLPRLFIKREAPFHTACHLTVEHEVNMHHFLKALLRRPYDDEDDDTKKETAEQKAAREAIVNEPDDDGNTALHWAMGFGLPHTANALMRHGARLDQHNNAGELPRRGVMPTTTRRRTNWSVHEALVRPWKRAEGTSYHFLRRSRTGRAWRVGNRTVTRQASTL